MTNKRRQNIFEDHAASTYKDSRLVGQVPIEPSFLFCKFIEKRNNQIFAEANDGRKLENGLVVNKKHIETFSEEINQLKKGKTIHMNIKRGDIFLNTLFWFNF